MTSKALGKVFKLSRYWNRLWFNLCLFVIRVMVWDYTKKNRAIINSLLREFDYCYGILAEGEKVKLRKRYKNEE